MNTIIAKVNGLGKEVFSRINNAVAFFQENPSLNPTDFEVVHVIGMQPILKTDEGIKIGVTHSKKSKKGETLEGYVCYVIRKDITPSL